MNENSPRRIVAGSLFALFVTFLVAALTVFGIISMALGHFFMFLAFLVGVLLIWTEIVPSRPPKHKVIATLVLLTMMGLGDLEIIRYKQREALSSQTAEPKPVPATPYATPVAPNVPISNRRGSVSGPSPALPDVSPELPTLGFQDNSDVVEASFGTLTGGNHIALLKEMKGRPAYPLDYNGVTPVSFRYVNGRVSYSVKFWSPEQHSVIEVQDGKFTVRNDSLDRNYSSRALEVVTSDGHPILQIIWLTPGHMRLNGLFPLPDGRVLCMSNDSPRSVSSANPFTMCDIPPIFKYPSWKFPSVLAASP